MIPADARPPCQDRPQLFFDEHPGSAEQAKAICRECPYAGPCGDYAMAYDVSGIWSGTTTAERQRARQRAGIVPVPIVANGPRRTRVA
jgi:hypothetical protein